MKALKIQDSAPAPDIEVYHTGDTFAASIKGEGIIYTGLGGLQNYFKLLVGLPIKITYNNKAVPFNEVERFVNWVNNDLDNKLAVKDEEERS